MSGIIGERQFRSPSRARSNINLRNMSGIIGERELRSRSKAKSSSNIRNNNVTDDTAFTSTRVTATTSASFSVNGNHSERTEVSNHADGIYDSGGYIQDDGGGQNRFEEGDNPWVNGQFKSPEEVRDYYKSFGDWWNYFPKTDNSYDPTSKWFGKEVAPGIPTIPNMARQPLHPISTKSSLERFFQRSSNQSGEVVSVTSLNSRIINFFYKIITTITTVITTVWYRVTNFASVNSSASSSSNNVSNSKASHSTTVIDSEVYVWWKAPYRWLYRLSTWLFMTGVWVQCILNHRFSRIRSTKHKYLKFIIILLLLPLIALLGWFYYTKSSDNITMLYNDAASSVNEHLNISASFFHNFFNTIASSVSNLSGSLIGSLSYIYSLLPVFTQYFKSSSTETSHGSVSIDNEQLSILVQQTVRDVLQKDSAILLENTVNHPRFKVLMEEALAEKSGSWDPSELLASDEWKAAVRDVVEQHYHENFKMDALEEHIRNIELKADQSVDELTKLKEFSSKLHEKIIALEKHIHLVLEQFVTVEHLEKTIQNLTLHLQYQGKIDEEHVIEKILSDVTVKVKEDITTLFKSIHENHHMVEITNADINLDQVKDYVSLMIERALALYDADKIGMVDYALESSGGSVVSTRCTESYSAGHRTYVLFGFALWHRSNSPRTVIQPGVQPGECWAFAGQQGYIVLQLSATIVVTAFTVEHIPRSLAPQGRINSAPKDFSVWGLKYESDMDPVFLGRFHFMENGTSLQKFEAEHVQEPFRLVELKIESNHGNLDYTCLYRFRVHGIPVS